MMTHWITGLSVSHDDRAIYTHLIRSPSDPHRTPRPEGGHKDRAPHRTLAKRPGAEIEELLLSGLEDGEPRTFNRLGVEIFDLTADVLFTTPVNTILWQLVAQGRIEHTLEAPILFRYRKGESRMEDQDQDQQNQEGEELLKMIGAEEDRNKEERDERQYASNTLLSLTEISKQTGIMYVTLKKYAVIHASTDLAGLWEGEGKNKKYHPEAVEVFKRLKAESKKGRPRGGERKSPTVGRVEDPLPPTTLSSKKGGKRKGAKKGGVKRAVKPGISRPETSPLPSSSSPLATQEADRAMAAIERVQLMARYEAVKEMVGPWVKEMERLEKVLGLGEAMR